MGLRWLICPILSYVWIKNEPEESCLVMGVDKNLFTIGIQRPVKI